MRGKKTREGGKKRGRRGREGEGRRGEGTEKRERDGKREERGEEPRQERTCTRRRRMKKIDYRKRWGGCPTADTLEVDWNN